MSTVSADKVYESVAKALDEPSKVFESQADEHQNSAVMSGRILDFFASLFANIDLSSMTEEEFLSAAGKLFDNFVVPLLASTPAGVIATPFVRAIFMNRAKVFYRNHSGPRVVPNPKV